MKLEQERWVVVEWSSFDDTKYKVYRFENMKQATEFMKEREDDWSKVSSASMSERYFIGHWMEEHPWEWDSLKKEIGL